MLNRMIQKLKASLSLRKAARIIFQGGIIAYPTEAVFGLGCNPLDPQAVQRLLQLKKRTPDKGFILLGSDFKQVEPFVESLTPAQLSAVFSTWPGPVTWLFPASPQAPTWLTGCHQTIAIRITAHPVARALCVFAGMPLISTSANLNGMPPLRSAEAVRQFFKQGVDYVVDGQVGTLTQPTPIYDARTGHVIRAAESN